MKISDITYVEDLQQEENSHKVVGGTFGLFSWPFGGGSYNQQPQTSTTVINNININNSSSSSSSSGSSAGAYSSGSGSHYWSCYC